MNWEDVRYFLTVARTGNLSEAAAQLEVSPSTAARRIERLEKATGQVLFVRRHNGYQLTPVGESLRAHAEAIESQMAVAKRGLAVESQITTGVVRLAVPELITHELLIPALPEFRKHNPEISLELLADVRPVSLKKRAADIVIRFVRPDEGDYTIRRIGGVAAALFGSPRYLETHGTPKEPQDLARHDVIGWDQDLKFLVMYKWLTDLAGEQKPWITTSSITAQFIACRNSLGLAVLPTLIGNRAGLIRVLPHLPALQLDTWLLVRTEVAQTKRVRRVVDFLSQIFSDPALLRA